MSKHSIEALIAEESGSIAWPESAFIEVADAFIEIRDRKLYRGVYETFDQYCKAAWHMSESRINRIISASEMLRNPNFSTTSTKQEEQ